jgi:glutamyl-tRNA reductase
LALRTGLKTNALILETCHRVEAYITRPDGAEPPELGPWLPSGGRVLVGEAAVRHAMLVATGRDSVVVGEDQILHQLRGSLQAARSLDVLDPAIDRLFALALQAGRRARSWRAGRQRSLADVALEHVELRSGPVRGRDVLVVGAGRMGDLAARAAARVGASVTVANRSIEPARALASAIGGTACSIDPGHRADRYAAVIVALTGPWVIHSSTVEMLIDGSAIVVDLSVPPAVPDLLATGLGRRLITADELALAADQPSSGDLKADQRTNQLIEDAVRAFIEWQARGDARAAADALVRLADQEREAELSALWMKLPSVEPDVREAIEGMTRHLAARLLRQPLERLGRDSDDVDSQAVRDLFAL